MTIICHHLQNKSKLYTLIVFFNYFVNCSAFQANVTWRTQGSLFGSNATRRVTTHLDCRLSTDSTLVYRSLTNRSTQSTLSFWWMNEWNSKREQNKCLLVREREREKLLMQLPFVNIWSTISLSHSVKLLTLRSKLHSVNHIYPSFSLLWIL